MQGLDLILCSKRKLQISSQHCSGVHSSRLLGEPALYLMGPVSSLRFLEMLQPHLTLTDCTRELSPGTLLSLWSLTQGT